VLQAEEVFDVPYRSHWIVEQILVPDGEVLMAGEVVGRTDGRLDGKPPLEQASLVGRPAVDQEGSERRVGTRHPLELLPLVVVDPIPGPYFALPLDGPCDFDAVANQVDEERVREEGAEERDTKRVDRKLLQESCAPGLCHRGREEPDQS